MTTVEVCNDHNKHVLAPNDGVGQRFGTAYRPSVEGVGGALPGWPVELRHIAVTDDSVTCAAVEYEMTHRKPFYGGVYVYRTRKPGALFGISLTSVAVATLLVMAFLVAVGWPPVLALPLLLCSGRHFAYVGETKSFRHRDRQHLNGDPYWGSKAKPWCDLDPKCYRLPLPGWKWLLRSVETLGILACWPVYNDRKNRWNPRRISIGRQYAMRMARDGAAAKATLRARAYRQILTMRLWHVAALFAGVVMWWER